MITIFFSLLSVHFLCDYPLQGDFIGKFKNRHAVGKQEFRPIPWYHLMAAHAFIHAGGVYLITQNIYFYFAELILHFIIDVLKCERYTNIHQDQALHVACKLLYVLVIFYA